MPGVLEGPEGAVADGVHIHGQVMLGLDGVVQVEDQAGLVGLGVGEAVDGGAGGGGHLSLDAVALQIGRVVAGLGHLVAFGEVGGVSAVLQGVDLRVEHLGSDGGDYQEVAQVGATGAAQVVLGEAVDQRVGVMVAGARVPAVDAGIGGGLDHAVGHDGAGEGVAVAAGADERVDSGDAAKAAVGNGGCCYGEKGCAHKGQKGTGIHGVKGLSGV